MNVKFTLCNKKYFFSACNKLAKLKENISSAAIYIDSYDEVRAVITAVVGSSFCGNVMTIYVAERWLDNLAKDCAMLRRTDRGLELKGVFEIQPFPEGVQVDYILSTAGENALSAGEALSDHLRRIACNANYVYDAVRKNPPLWQEMVKELEGSDYNFSSSLLLAMHAYVKLRASGVAAADDISMVVDYEKRIVDEALRGHLLAMEHSRWLAFVSMYGYRMPEMEKIRKYAFKTVQGFRDEDNMLHPAMVPCDPDGRCALREWSPDDWEKRDLDGLDNLDRISVLLHRMARERANEFQAELDGIFDRYEQDGISFPDLTTALERIKSGQSSRQAFEAALEAAIGLSADDEARIRRLTAPLIECNRYMDYKASDAAAAEQLGFILAFGKSRCRNIVRELSRTAEANASAAILLDPEKMLLIIPHDMPKADAERRVRGLKTMIRQRAMMTQIYTARACEFSVEAYNTAFEALCADSGVKNNEVVADFTEASAAFTEASAALNAIYTTKGLHVHSFRGCPEADVFNRVHRTLTVDNLLALEDFQKNPAWQIGNWPDIRKALPVLMKTYLEVTDGDKDSLWSECSKYLEGNSQYRIIDPEGKAKKKILLSKPENPQYQFKICERIPTEKALSMNLTGLIKRLAAEKYVKNDKYFIMDDKIAYSCAAVSSKIGLLFSLAEPEQLVIRQQGDGHVIQQLAATIQRPKENAKARKMLDALTDCGILIPENGSLRYSSSGVRTLLLKQGSILEDYIYHHVQLCGGFRDVQLSCEYAPRERMLDWGKHETDVFAINSKNNPVFFSCKTGVDIEMKDIMAVIHDSREFGFSNAVVVFVASCSMENLKRRQMDPMGRVRAASEHNGVYFIDRDILADPDRLNSMLLEISKA